MAKLSAATIAPARPPALSAGPACVPRIADVTLFYGERSGGIRTYLEAKAAFAARTGAFEHHLVVPQELRSLRVVSSNGYRVPIGSSGLCATLRELRPDAVLLHDPYWTPRLATRVAHEVGATVIAVHHSSVALHAAGLPGPDGVYTKALQRWYRRAYRDVDAVMSVVDPAEDGDRACTLPLRLGLDPAFRPELGAARGDHVLYVGRLAREKGLRELLEAAAAARPRWPLVLLGTGPAGDALRERARQLGLGDRISFAPYVEDRDALARAYANARCVVLPGPHETFGLVALEAAACGVPVVTSRSTPSASLIAGFVETFRAGDATDLLRAIERARSREPDPGAARALVARHGWDAAIEAELADLKRLLAAR
ncbi:MAG TPA: glycosyltransferase [Solirubrobacteraceae bacterium]|nr:glycosyltransferase [Solirubrobacteraceae bacterium]